MIWSSLHADLLCSAARRLLGVGERGTMAFVRCLSPEVVTAMAKDEAFHLDGWQVRRVADVSDPGTRTVTADEAVELRESKEQPVLLLVDVARAGAGMDGIYSAARELQERELFREAIGLAAREVTKARSSDERHLAEQAIKTARGRGRQRAVPPWTEFDFLVEVALNRCFPGELLHRLGLWPVVAGAIAGELDPVDLSKRFVDRLLGPASSGQTPGQRVASLRLSSPTPEQLGELERFLRAAATIPVQSALEKLGNLPQLWIGALKVEPGADTISRLELVPWFEKGKLAKWSGLVAQADEDAPPELVLDPEADKNGNYSKLEVRWRTVPAPLEKGSVSYRVAIVTDLEEELAYREIAHSSRKEEMCRFSNDDFTILNNDALVSAKAVVSVPASPNVLSQTSEEFQIRFGARDQKEPAGVGKRVRCFSEGLCELESHDAVSAPAAAIEVLPVDGKGYLVLRTSERSKSYRVFSPVLLREVERSWMDNGGGVGRWRVKVRASGARAGAVEFVPIRESDGAPSAQWERVSAASRRMADRFVARGGAGQIYDQRAKAFEAVYREYLLAWAALLEGGSPQLALANTVEVQSLSGRTIGLIVLPAHPLRVAWHVAYDNLVLYSAFECHLSPKDVRDEFAALDGAMFPAFLPGVSSGATFVFGDTLGFHTVGMVADDEKEPKAALAILARALGDAEGTEAAPTVGRQSSQILGSEILKYMRCHSESRFLQVHALRAGDGLTVARSLGHVQRDMQRLGEPDTVDEQQSVGTSFVLELYPSDEQRGVAGRFITEAREKRRSGAGTLAEDDRWMLESLSLPGGISLPRLRWARKRGDPVSAAHLAIAFDTFECRVRGDDDARATARPYFVYGLLSFFDRQYASVPSPVWQSRCAVPTDGEKHPADRTHTERLSRLLQVTHNCAARNIKAAGGLVLRAEITAERALDLSRLHRLCDWVITLDRNAGMEYFDSPRDNGEIYDAYVIDCVPEREDLGCLQLITSTSNLEEVRRLLDASLDQMGLSRSRRNAEFLMAHLKALSGRLAIRLTGQRAPTSELIALALSHAYATQALPGSDCWPSLRDGFIIPIDDVQDLLPPVSVHEGEGESGSPRGVRPDLLYVWLAGKGALAFRFIEVKYRRHLRDARSPDLLESVCAQVEGLTTRWQAWYSGGESASPLRSVRRAKLARVLRFYADKARRHADDSSGLGLSQKAFEALASEIDRMVEKGSDYRFEGEAVPGLGWIFCPEYTGQEPLSIAPSFFGTSIFLFGPRPLPDGPSPFGQPNVVAANPSADDQLRQADHARGGEVGTARDGDVVKSDRGTVTAAGAGSGGGGEAVAEDAVVSSAEAAEVGVKLGRDMITGGDVVWPLAIKGNPHLLVAGLPGMGKTTCLLNMVKQMVSGGVRPIVFSYHEDIDQRLAASVQGIRFIDFHGLGFNPLQVIDRQTRLGYLDVAGTLRDIFGAIFPELGDIQGERIRGAIKQSFVEAGWDGGAGGLQAAKEPPFKRFFEILLADPKPDRGLQTLLARLGELADYGLFEVSAEGESLWDSASPTVIRVHETQNEVLQNAFASLVFYKLYKDMFRRGTQQRITHAVIFDEAHRAARLTLIPTMAKECRKYGIALVLASQEARDFHSSVFSAIANYLVLRVTEADAKVLIRNVASSDQERGLIDKIKQMEKYRALYFSERQKKPSVVALLGE